MIGQPLVFLFIEQEFLPGISFLDTLDLLRSLLISMINAVNHKKIIAMADILCINGVEITLTKGQVIDGIQEVCLSRAVVSDKTVDLVGKNIL
jgi:hypothetical protein